MLTESKLFCPCSTRFGDLPNSNVCPVCLGLPGALPVLNKSAVSMAIQAAFSLGCRINASSIFARKNYFYPDLPKGYQISQYDQPLASSGAVSILSQPLEGEDLEFLTFRIHRVHLEDDAGKSIHRNDGSSYVDLNRTGVPLIEIVTEPDLRSPRQAHDLLASVHRGLLYLGVCDGNMEQGSLRCDANISLRRRGEERLGTKTEIKNMNSFRFLRKALEFEIERQAGILKDGGRIDQETRLWDEQRQVTLSMRSKEYAHDYRYFPDPDLMPVQISDAWLGELEKDLPEIPEEKQKRFIDVHGLLPADALLLTQRAQTADFFEEAVQAGAPARHVLNWIAGDLTRALKSLAVEEISDTKLTPAALAELIGLVERKSISQTVAKQVLEIILETGESPAAVVSEKGWGQISDREELSDLVSRILAENPDKVAAYREGKTGLMGFFVGQAMRATQGQANPHLLNELLGKSLEEE